MNMFIMGLLLIMSLAHGSDSGLVDAIKFSNINQLVPRPAIRLKASFSFKEAVNCDVHPEHKTLLVTLNPTAWYALSGVDQVDEFCKEMHRCDDRISCPDLKPKTREVEGIPEFTK